MNLDPERQQKAQEYAAIGRKIFVIELVMQLVYVLAWLGLDLASVWRDQIYQFTTSMWLTVPLFAIGFSLPLMIVGAPLDFYSGFTLPHRYGQSEQTLRSWLLDQLKGLLLSGVLGLFVLQIIYFLMAFAPQTWWLWMAGVMLIFTVLLSNLAPVLIFPLFFTFKPLEDNELVTRLTQLATRAGTRVQGVFVFDLSSKTTAANAALMGLGNTRRIVLGDTLVNQFTTDEIETVLAHELGHQVHHDIMWGMVIQTGLTLLGFWLANGLMQWGVTYWNYLGLADPATLPLFIIAMLMFSLVTMPLNNLWSRWREVMADDYALTMTHMPHAFISAMTRLANQNLAEAEPPAWVEFLLHSHPSINKRVAQAQAFAQRHG